MSGCRGRASEPQIPPQAEALVGMINAEGRGRHGRRDDRKGEAGRCPAVAALAPNYPSTLFPGHARSAAG